MQLPTLITSGFEGGDRGKGAPWEDTKRQTLGIAFCLALASQAHHWRHRSLHHLHLR